jgi:tetratricopeptide (TPR) repeat protein
MKRALRIAGWGYVAICAALVAGSLRRPADAPAAAARPSAARQPVVAQTGVPAASVWFRRVRPYCNPVEAQVVIRDTPAPPTVDGQAFLAACYALAGRIDDARRVIDALPRDSRAKAAGIVFEIGHPVADGGDDRSAGPIMELVIDYWPNHYMALYHAGMAEYMLGQHALARKNLRAFLEIYQAGDGWVSNAREVLARIDDPKGRGRELRRPREPGR